MLIPRSVHPLPGEAERQARLLALIDGFSSRRVVVVGDLIADEFIYGDVSRVSREAPGADAIAHANAPSEMRFSVDRADNERSHEMPSTPTSSGPAAPHVPAPPLTQRVPAARARLSCRSEPRALGQRSTVGARAPSNAARQQRRVGVDLAVEIRSRALAG